MKNRRNILSIYITNIIVATIFILPLVWMIVTSFKPENRVFQDIGNINAFIPVDFTIENYSSVFNRIPMLRYIWNSIFYISIILKEIG